RHDLGERRERRLVRDIARREEQSGFLAVQAGQLAFEVDVVPGGARDVARAARSCSEGIHRLVHRLDYIRVLPHAEIVVRAPDGDVLLAAVIVPDRGLGKLPPISLEVDEYPVAPLGPDFFQGVLESSQMFHGAITRYLAPRLSWTREANLRPHASVS